MMMNITETGLKNYLETFNTILKATSEQFMPTQVKGNLLHLSLLPAHIIGYVSTQYGVAIEYQPAEQTVVEIKKGSARVEDLLIQAPKYLREEPALLFVSSSKNQVSNVTFVNRYPFRLSGLEASLFIKNTEFKAKDWNKLISYAEVYGNREKTYWSEQNAIARAKDEVLAALVELQHAEALNISLADYIARYKQKTVLLLGDYDDNGLERLSKIAIVLKELNYEPLLIRNIPDNPYQDISQKVVAVGAISRFIVVDDSSKSGHLSEVQLCKQNNWITILLRANGIGGSWMTAGAAHFSNVILEKSYDVTNPKLALKESVHWAEKKMEELKIKFESTYPWRAT
ncbi:MAG: hypothetical protein IT362_09690 [Deltaproteobacteria bacterium]|nr:hypothetical protein [Deltaproteobacteria bacterium]